ncbi:AraC family transcriptional regulator [Victivallis vadensis]|uniref:AraC family transcriptional regulator n=1 Tax=Victivallis vadensis TaxID=172901 RepID=UPI0026DC17FF|nr:AraC family transcriptional regulator [Victivallis vadensis]
MRTEYHWNLADYVQPGKLPIYVSLTPRGEHPSRFFHDHECSEIAIVTGGSALHLVEPHRALFPGKAGRGEAYMCGIRRGDVLVIHPGITHAYDRTSDLELLNIVYDRRRLVLPMLDGYALPLFRQFFPPGEEPAPEEMARPVASLAEEALEQVLVRVEELRAELEGLRPGSLFSGLTLFMTALVAVARLCGAEMPKKRRTPFLVGDAVSFIAKNYSKPVTLDQMARAARMSRRSFCRHFRCMAGCSPAEYLQQFRIARAEELLTETDASVAEIALRCGFCDGNYFCRKFREIKGITPGAHRRASRSASSSG